MSAVDDDAARFLFLVPYVAARREGVVVDELCEMLSVDLPSLTRLLERVCMVGAPDGSPDELVDVYLEGGRVHVALPQRFTRPPRFTAEELLVLMLTLSPLKDSALPGLSAQAAALGERLVSAASGDAKKVAAAVDRGVFVREQRGENPDHLSVLERAVAEHRAVDCEYYTASRDELTARRLEPCALISHRGAWYLVDSGQKLFKVERLREIALRDETFEPPADLDLETYRRDVLYLGASPVEGRVRYGDRVQRYPASSGHSLKTHIRTLGGRAELLEPLELRREFVEETRALLARYEDAQ